MPECGWHSLPQSGPRLLLQSYLPLFAPPLQPILKQIPRTWKAYVFSPDVLARAVLLGISPLYWPGRCLFICQYSCQRFVPLWAFQTHALAPHPLLLCRPNHSFCITCISKVVIATRTSKLQTPPGHGMLLITIDWGAGTVPSTK